MEEILKSYNDDTIMNSFRLKTAKISADEVIARSCDEGTREVINKLLCRICQNFPSDSVDLVKCQNCKEIFFCRQCFVENRICPICNKSEKTELNKSDALILTRCVLKCRNFMDGCESQLSLEMLRTHENECGFKKHLCKICGVQVTRQCTKEQYLTCQKKQNVCAQFGKEDLSHGKCKLDTDPKQQVVDIGGNVKSNQENEVSNTIYNLTQKFEKLIEEKTKQMDEKLGNLQRDYEKLRDDHNKLKQEVLEQAEQQKEELTLLLQRNNNKKFGCLAADLEKKIKTNFEQFDGGFTEVINRLTSTNNSMIKFILSTFSPDQIFKTSFNKEISKLISVSKEQLEIIAIQTNNEIKNPLKSANQSKMNIIFPDLTLILVPYVMNTQFLNLSGMNLGSNGMKYLKEWEDCLGNLT